MALNEILNRFFFCNFKVIPVDKSVYQVNKKTLLANKQCFFDYRSNFLYFKR